MKSCLQGRGCAAWLLAAGLWLACASAQAGQDAPLLSPPGGASSLGAAQRPLESAPRAGLRPARPPRGASNLGAAQRLLESAPRAGLRPARPPRGSRKLGAALRFLVSARLHQ